MVDIEKYADGTALFDGQYKLLRCLSDAGGTADVWLALAVKTIDTLGNYSEDDEYSPDENTGMKVAIKIYRLQGILDIEGEQRFKDEFKIVYNCHHANLLPPSHFSIFEDTPYLVMPYCENGSSEKLIGKVEDTELLWKYIHDVASGLSYLHACNPPIIHQDIKPANVLIDSNGNFSITDFGISSKKSNDTSCFHEDANNGTLVYMAPERFCDNPEPRPESDIWALGATLFEFVTGDVPFGDDGGLAQEQGAKKPEIKQKVPKEVKKLIYACLEKEPSKRPTAQQIVDIVIGRRLNRNRIKYLVICLFAVLITSLALFYTNDTKESPSNELCYSADSIIFSIKKDINNNGFEVNDSTRAKIIQANAFYRKALALESEDVRKKQSIIKKTEMLTSVDELYKEHNETCSLIKQTELDDLPIQNAIQCEKKDSIENEIIILINDL